MRTIVAALLAVVIASAGVLADAAASNNAARRTIAFVPLPELGHFNPFAAVIDGYVRSEPTARCRVLVPEFFRKHCDDAVADLSAAKIPGSDVQCVTYTTWMHDYTEEFMVALVAQHPLETIEVVDEKVREWQLAVGPAMRKELETTKYDAVVGDFGVHAAVSAAADATKTPLIIMWPLVLQFPGVTRDPRIPAFALALSLDMSWPLQMLNALSHRVSLLKMTYKHQLFAPLREAAGLPVNTALSTYRNYPILTPALISLDIAQPLYPNVHPVGLLQAPVDDTAALPAEWADWLSRCNKAHGGIVYVNMGSVGHLTTEWVREFETALVNVSSSRCVLWKLSKHKQQELSGFGSAANANQKVAHWLPFSPRLLFKQRLVSVFLTHCGDTSVYETVQFGAAFVGFPLFADQPDVCARIVDAKVGVALDKLDFDAKRLATAIETAVGMEPDARLRMARMRVASKLQGESRRAVELLQLAIDGVTPALSKPVNDWFFDTDGDIVVIVAAALYVMSNGRPIRALVVVSVLPALLIAGIL